MTVNNGKKVKIRDEVEKGRERENAVGRKRRVRDIGRRTKGGKIGGKKRRE